MGNIKLNMKIKRFKDFKYRSNIDDIHRLVDDIFEPLRDLGFIVEIEQSKHSDEWQGKDYIEEEISFRIVTDRGPLEDRRTFIIEDDSEESIELKDCILRCNDIMEDWDLGMEIRYKSDYDRSPIKAKNIKLDGDKFVYTTPFYQQRVPVENRYDESLVDVPILLLLGFFTRRIELED